MATFLETFGDGSDGAYAGGALVKGQEYKFTSFNLDAYLGLGTGDGSKVIVRVQGDLTLGSSCAITSGTHATKDSATVSVAGSSYSVASTDGANGGHGGGGVRLTADFGEGGTGGAVPNAGTAGGAGGSNAGGAGGSYPGGDGGSGGGSQYAAGGGGGGGAGYAAAGYQNGIIFIVGGQITLAGSLSGIGASGGTGGNGRSGTTASQIQASAGGGGGGAGAGGTGGILVKLFSLLTTVGTLSLTTTGGIAGNGGSGGGSFYGHSSQVGTDGTAGTAGTVGSQSFTQISTGAFINGMVVQNIFAEQVKFTSSVDSDGGATITERGFVYAKTINPTTADNKEIITGTIGEIEKIITGLDSADTYFVRPYAINSIETTYGEEVEFATGPERDAATTLLDSGVSI